MKFKVWAMVLFFLITGSRESQALCLSTTLESVASTHVFQGPANQYEVYDTVEHMATVNIQVRSRANLLGCNYYVLLSPGLSGNASQRKMGRGAERLNYNVYLSPSKSNILKDTGGSGSERITGNFSSLIGGFQVNDHSYYWTVEPKQVFGASATPFEDAGLSMKLYAELIAGIYTLTDTKAVTFKTKIESSVDLSLVNQGGVFNASDVSQAVDFGDMTSGEMLSYDTMVRSNDGYVVTIKSQNKQKLVHTNPLVADTVPYNINFGGGSLNLTSGAPVQAISSTGVTSALGARFQTDFILGTLSGAESAGNYQDILTVTVSAH